MSTEMVQKDSRNPITFAWSHQAWLHRKLVRIYNAIMKCVPIRAKYAIGKRMRADQYPYKLISPGSTLVQIGAPYDTLGAGRSRGLYFSLFNGPAGKTILIEPASQSKDAYEQVANKLGLRDLVFCCTGAWNEKKQLKIYFDPNHPATNFTEGTVDYDEQRLAEFEIIEVPCDTVDNVLDDLGIDTVDVLSITTNGAEQQILEGMTKVLERGVQYICLATHEHLDHLPQFLDSLGYEQFALDDRGVTYQKRTDGSDQASPVANS